MTRRISTNIGVIPAGNHPGMRRDVQISGSTKAFAGMALVDRMVL